MSNPKHSPVASSLPELQPYLLRVLVGFRELELRHEAAPTLSALAKHLSVSKGHIQGSFDRLTAKGYLVKFPPPVRYAPYRLTPLAKRIANREINKALKKSQASTQRPGENHGA